MSARNLRQQSAKGFTLIELLVAVVIVSILAAIAVPAYQGYIRRANRAIVRATLTDLAAKQDVLRVQTRVFASTFAPLNSMTGTSFYIDRNNTATTASSSSAIYKITLSSPADNSYSLLAEIAGYQLKDTDCASLTLTSTGVRSALKSDGSSNPACWRR